MKRDPKQKRKPAKEKPQNPDKLPQPHFKLRNFFHQVIKNKAQHDSKLKKGSSFQKFKKITSKFSHLKNPRHRKKPARPKKQQIDIYKNLKGDDCSNFKMKIDINKALNIENINQSCQRGYQKLKSGQIEGKYQKYTQSNRQWHHRHFQQKLSKIKKHWNQNLTIKINNLRSQARVINTFAQKNRKNKKQ